MITLDSPMVPGGRSRPDDTAGTALERLDLPSDWPLSAGRPFAAGWIAGDRSTRLHDALAAAAAATASSPARVSLALFALLLYRHGGQTGLTLDVWDPDGALGAGMERGTIRVTVSAPSTFAGLVAGIAAALGTLPDAAGEGGPAWRANVLWAGSPLPIPSPAADLTLAFDDETAGARWSAGYNQALFRPERVREWLDQIEVLAAQVAADPGRPVLQYSLITARGRALLPDPTAALETPDPRPVTETLLDWCERTPETTAVVAEGRCWTYRELAATSAHLARCLLARGATPGDLVAVTGRRGFAFVTAMLGVWRAGGVLLTLDPALPAERRRTMALEANARFLVGIGDAGREIADVAPHLVILDARTALSACGDEADRVALPDIDPAQPAYIFFTSGSTGVPKGVKGLHRGLAHFLDWQRTTFGIGPKDRASQLTALSFDVVLRDTFLVLTSGGTLCIPGENDVLDPARILAWLDAQAVSVLHVVPSLARMWLGHVPEGVTLANLRRVFFAGEPLPDTLVRKWRDLFSNAAEIVNLYGPTETTLAKCCHRLGDELDPGVQSIGRPLPNTQVLILNPAHQQCGLEETGEIAIRTPLRTLGYINNPEAQARAFIPNPFREADAGDDLIYLTGDSGRYRTDGLLTILGRIDNQVKIRGVRIEPGEIETAIASHPAVRETAVVARADESGEKFLVAYVVPKDAAATADRAMLVSGLRAYLRARLPENLVPSAFVALESLPLNPNGKIDKRALPAPDRSAFVGADYSPPEDDLQDRLADVWQDLLGLDRVGIDDNFFDLGGHSLMAVQLVHAIEERLQRGCPLTTLFRAPTIRLLADAIQAGSEGSDQAAVLPLQEQGEGPPLFCIVGIYLYQSLAKTLAPDVPVYGIFLPYEEKLFALASAGETERLLSMEEMAAGYVAAVRGHQPRGPYLLAGVSFGGTLAFEMARQLTALGEKVAFLGILDSMLPTALKRNWIRWAGMHFRRLLAEGPAYVVAKLRHRFVATRATAGASTPTPEDEAARLGAIRQEIYKRAELAYRVEPYPGPAVLVRAEDKSWFGSDIADPTYGWGGKIERLTILDAPGGHLGILEEPHVRVLSDKLRPYIEAARRGA